MGEFIPEYVMSTSNFGKILTFGKDSKKYSIFREIHFQNQNNWKEEIIQEIMKNNLGKVNCIWGNLFLNMSNFNFGKNTKNSQNWFKVPGTEVWEGFEKIFLGNIFPKLRAIYNGKPDKQFSGSADFKNKIICLYFSEIYSQEVYF